MATIAQIQAELARRAKAPAPAVPSPRGITAAQIQAELARRQQAQIQPLPDRRAELLEDVGPFEAGLIAFGKGLTNIGTGARRLLAAVSGDEAEEARIKKQAQEAEQEFATLRQQFPVATFAGEVAGEVGALPIGGVGTGLARAATAAVTGATTAGLAEAGRGTAAGQVAEAATLGAVLGPVGEALGAVAGVGGRKTKETIKKGTAKLFGVKKADDLPKEFFDEAGNLTNTAAQAADQLDVGEKEFREAFSGLADDLKADAADLGPTEAFRVAEAAAEGVELTRGQVTRDFATASLEDTLRSLEGEAGTQARQFFRDQQDQLIAAKDRFLGDLQADLSQTAAQRGAQVRGTLRDLDSLEKSSVRALYETLGQLKDTPEGLIPIKGTEVLPELSRGIIREFGLEGSQVARIIDNSLEDFEGRLTVGNMNDFIKRLNRATPSDPSEIAALSEFKNRFKDLAVATVDEIPEGSQVKALADTARQRAADRFATFKSKDIIQNLIDFKKGTTTDKVSDAQVLDTVLRGGRRVDNLKRVKNVLTRNPTKESTQAWKEIQAQAALDIFGKAVTETPDGFTISGAKLGKAIKDFGEDALGVAFTGPQRQILKRIQRVTEAATVSVPRTTNPSGSAAKIANMLGRLVNLGGGGMTDKFASLLGAGINSVADTARRNQALAGLSKGATPLTKSRTFMQSAIQNSIGATTPLVGLEAAQRAEENR